VRSSQLKKQQQQQQNLPRKKGKSKRLLKKEKSGLEETENLTFDGEEESTVANEKRVVGDFGDDVASEETTEIDGTKEEVDDMIEGEETEDESEPEVMEEEENEIDRLERELELEREQEANPSEEIVAEEIAEIGGDASIESVSETVCDLKWWDDESLLLTWTSGKAVILGSLTDARDQSRVENALGECFEEFAPNWYALFLFLCFSF
jgi:hypothetical protein